MGDGDECGKEETFIFILELVLENSAAVIRNEFGCLPSTIVKIG